MVAVPNYTWESPDDLRFGVTIACDAAKNAYFALTDALYWTEANTPIASDV
jgi:hypothetical protein